MTPREHLLSAAKPIELTLISYLSHHRIDRDGVMIFHLAKIVGQLLFMGENSRGLCRRL